MRRAVLALVLVVAAVPGWAQAPTTSTPPTTEPPRPALELGPDTPRGAVARFLAAARTGQYARAAEYLNVRGVPRAARSRLGPELARELETVLDRALWIDLDRLSDQPAGDLDDGLPSNLDSLGTIETSAGPVEILLERIPQPGGPAIWKFSASTVGALPALYDEFGWGPLADLLPAPFFEVRFLQIRLWQWVGLIVLVAVAWLVSRLVRGLLVRLARWILASRGKVDGGLAEYAAGPLRLLVGLAVFASGLPFLALAVRPHRFFVGLQSALAIVAMTWILLRTLDVVAARFERQLVRNRHARAVASVPLLRRTVKIFVAGIAFIAALQNFGFNVTGLLAGLGVGGLAVALAAQKTVENLFGSLSIVADQPVRVGDVCRFGETVGTVEDIGLRSTRIRTINRTVVTVPNGQFSIMPLENLSRRDRIPVHATLSLPPGTTPEQVREVLRRLRETLPLQPKVDAASVRARFVALSPQGLNVELFAHVLTTRWEEFVGIREGIFLATMDVVAGSGATLK
jgi:MscS family membrane protein